MAVSLHSNKPKLKITGNRFEGVSSALDILNLGIFDTQALCLGNISNVHVLHPRCLRYRLEICVDGHSE